MALRHGVQYATIEHKKCPMFDPICAAKVVEHVTAMIPRVPKDCTCGYADRVKDDLIAWSQNGAVAAQYPDTQHTAECECHQMVPAYDAAEAIEKSCGRYVRGAHKGQLRGWASIGRCTEGGWSRMGSGGGLGYGRVIYPGTVVSVSIGDDYTCKTYFAVTL